MLFGVSAHCISHELTLRKDPCSSLESSVGENYACPDLQQQLKNFHFFEDQFQVDALTGLRRARPAVAVAARAAAHRLCYRLMCFSAILFVDSDGDHFCKGLLFKELAFQPFAELNALCRRLLNLRLLLEGVEVKK